MLYLPPLTDHVRVAAQVRTLFCIYPMDRSDAGGNTGEGIFLYGPHGQTDAEGRTGEDLDNSNSNDTNILSTSSANSLHSHCVAHVLEGTLFSVAVVHPILICLFFILQHCFLPTPTGTAGCVEPW